MLAVRQHFRWAEVVGYRMLLVRLQWPAQHAGLAQWWSSPRIVRGVIPRHPLPIHFHCLCKMTPKSRRLHSAPWLRTGHVLIVLAGLCQGVGMGENAKNFI